MIYVFCGVDIYIYLCVCEVICGWYYIFGKNFCLIVVMVVVVNCCFVFVEEYLCGVFCFVCEGLENLVLFYVVDV